MLRKSHWSFQFSLHLLLAVALAFGTFMTLAPDRAWAGSGVLVGWNGSGFYPPFLATSGTPANSNVAALNTNTTNAFATSTGAPTGEMGVYIAYNWANGSGSKFWKVRFNSTGFQNLTVSSQQMSTNLGFGTWNGPRDFKLQYSLNDSAWTDVPGGATTLGSTWIASGRLTNLSLPAALNNQPNVYLRWIMTSNTSVTPAYPTTDSEAQSMIAGIHVNGTEIPSAPTDIQLNLSSLPLSSGDLAGTLVGELSVTDPNLYDTWTYSLVSGEGSTNNSSFVISGNQLSTSAQLPAGTYSIRVNVNDGTYNFAKALSITVVAYPPITGGTTSYGDYITNVTFAGINHDSGQSSSGYEDFSGLMGTVMQGESYPLSVTVNVGCPGDPLPTVCDGVVYPQYIKVWIDWNHDFDFNDPEEGYDVNPNTTSNGPHTIAITVPSAAALGMTRMRVVNNADNDADQTPPEPPNAGTTTFFGEAEDYTVEVTGLAITTGAISGAPFYVSATQSASVSVPYTAVGTYTAGNVFTAYLSNASGSFTGETAIGSRTATDSGTINATIPAGTASGTGYRIRIKSSSPEVTGSDNGVNFTITLDTTPPVVTVPANAMVEATGPSGAVYTFSATATDLAPANPVVTCNPASGSTFPLGPTTVTCSAKDAAGNTGSGTFTVTVRDTTAPTITVPANAAVEATGPSGAVYTFTATAADLVAPSSPAVTCNPASGSTFPLGATTVTCNAADAAGNTGSKTFTVTVQDTTGPVVTVPANATVEAAGPSGAVYTFTATAADLVAPLNPAVTCSPVSGSTFPLGTTTVTCGAADTAGNTGSKTFTVTVQDTTAPVVTVPANATVEAAGPSGAVYTFSATATDLVAPLNPSVTCDPASGSTFPLGDTTVTCKATDTAGNTGSSTFTVTVEDTTDPVITVPSNATVEATGPSGAVYTFTATAADQVAPLNPTVTCSPASGSTFPLGNTTVTCGAADAAGNSASKTFTVTVQDTTGPVVNVPSNATVEATGPSGAVYTFTATAADLVSPSSPTVNCDHASGSTFPLGDTTVTCSAADAAGNTGSKTFTVTVQDTTAPVVTVPDDVTLGEHWPYAGAVYEFTATATDLVTSSLTVTCTPASGSTFPLGTTTVTCTATDAAGNTGSATFTVTVEKGFLLFFPLVGL